MTYFIAGNTAVENARALAQSALPNAPQQPHHEPAPRRTSRPAPGSAPYCAPPPNASAASPTASTPPAPPPADPGRLTPPHADRSRPTAPRRPALVG